MTTQFITNENKLLTTVVNNILPSAKNLFFLVGYFYFSGFQEIYKNVKDKHIKILVGLDVEQDIFNKIKEVELIQNVNDSRGKVRENYFKSLVDLFNETAFFDSEEKQNSFRLFLEKIKNGTLEIKKTYQPNHAKLYIFQNKEEFNQGGEFPGTVITGSSNLSRSGFRDRFEINVVSRNSANYSEAYQIFMNLWENHSVNIVDKNNIDEFLYSVVSKTWLDKLPKPFLLYLRVLHEYFDEHTKDTIRLPAEISRGKYINLKYQIDAIKRGLNIIKRHNGIIIADVVGLGKSIIASTIAHNLFLKTIIITPPHLKNQWEDYRYEFEFNAKVYSSGKIEQALKENDQNEEKLIIIDEAHKYRNELTRDYALLHQLCQGNKVVLLSATPFNNRPQDIFSMVKLFQIPTRSTIQTADNLSYQFRELIKEYKNIRKIQNTGLESDYSIKIRIQKVADKIRDILSPLVVRRSRLDLDGINEYREDLEQQNISFPEVKDPELLEYNLGALSDLYRETLEAISPEDDNNTGFIGARYMPTNYIKNFEKYREKIAKEMGVDENLLKQVQMNLAKFMRRLIVRRFESSIYALESTLDSIIKSSKTILDWYYKIGKVPVYKKGKLPDVDTLLEAIEEDLNEDLKDFILDDELAQYKEKGLWLIDKKEIRKGFIDDVEQDIKILETIRDNWFGDGFPADPKIIHFKRILLEKLREEPNRKIVVFTEFSDTADYIYKELKDELRVFKYSSLEASQKNKNIIRENFDAGYKLQKNDYDVLIATDSISEGFNLHRAGIVFNYDIPYNPTRVIQRVGRINRINKKVFDELFIYNFFPTAAGEKEIGIKKISTLKIAMVHALLGEDTKVLTKDEELQAFFAKQFQEAIEIQEVLSPETKYENFIKTLRKSNPKLIEQAQSIPKRVKIRRTEKTEQSGILVFGKKGDEYAFKLGLSPKEYFSLSAADAFNLFETEISENAVKTSKDFDSLYQILIKNLFSKKKEVALDKGKREAILKVEALKIKLPNKKDYLDDLHYVIKELDALPDKYLKDIRAIDLKHLERDFKEITQEVSHKYLLNILDREKKIDEEKESIILAEELI
ncbi:MAG: helicase [Bacteroidales bacterium]|nr:helicase [Bacteroidales bacterium]